MISSALKGKQRSRKHYTENKSPLKLGLISGALKGKMRSIKHYTVNKCPLKPGGNLKRSKREAAIYKILLSKQKSAKTRG